MNLQTKKTAIAVAALLATVGGRALAVAPYVYSDGLAHFIDAGGSFAPMNAAADFGPNHFNPYVLGVSGGSSVSFSGANFALSARSTSLVANGIVLGGGSGSGSTLSIDGRPEGRAQISSDNSAIVVLNSIAGQTNSLALKNVSIRQGELGAVNSPDDAAISISGTRSVQSIDIRDSDITFGRGIVDLNSGLKISNSSIRGTSNVASAILLTGSSAELEATRLTVNAVHTAVYGAVSGTGDAASFKSMDVRNSSISTTGEVAHGFDLQAYTDTRRPPAAGGSWIRDRVFLDDVSISTAGRSSYGIYMKSMNGAGVDLDIKTSGQAAHGVVLYLNGSLQLTNPVIETQGVGSFGLYAYLTPRIDADTLYGPVDLSATGALISTQGQGAHAAVADGHNNAGGVSNHATLTLKSAVLNTTGDGAALLNGHIGGVLAVDRLTGTATGADATALLFSGAAASDAATFDVRANQYINSATLSNSTLRTNRGTGIDILGGGASDIVLDRTTIEAGAQLAPGERQALVARAQDVFWNGRNIGRLQAQDIRLTARNGSSLDGDVVLNDRSEVSRFDFDASSLRGNISLRDGSSFGQFDLRNGSRWTGAALTQATGKHIEKLSVDPSSSWVIAGGNSVVGDLSNQGTIRFQPPADGKSFQSLVVKGDYAGGGILTMNGAYRSDNRDSSTDSLLIEGNVLAGSPTRVAFTSIDSLGTTTVGDGIKVIQVMQQSAPGDFQQIGSTIAGAYQYTLAAADRNGAFDGNWYLTSRRVGPIDPEPPKPDAAEQSKQDPTPPPPPPPSPPLQDPQNYNALAISASVVPALANYLSLSALGTYQQRVAGADLAHDGRDGWARLYGGSGSVRQGGSEGDMRQRADSFETRGASYDRQISGVQVGQDLFSTNGSDHGARAGAYLGATHVQADVNGIYAGDGQVGSVRMDGFSLGAYWSYAQPQGWYVDANQMLSLYRDIRIDGGSVGSMKGHGWGTTTSVEVGFRRPLSEGWFIEPQGQLIYQHTSLSDARYMQSLQASFAASNALYGRLGARFGKTLEGTSGSATLYTHLDLWHTAGGNAQTTYGVPDRMGVTGLRLATDLGGSWLQAGVGVHGALTRQWTAYGSLDWQQGLQSGRGHGVMGYAGIRYAW